MKVQRLAVLLAAAAFLAIGRAPSAVGQVAQETPQPMAANADPSFAAATIKPSKPEEAGKNISSGYRTVLPGITMLKLVSFAYDLHNDQIAGAPKWMSDEQFDLEGVADIPGRPSVNQLKSMLKKLLVERCQLKFHGEKRQLSAYVLALGKNGAKISESKDLQEPTAFNIRQNASGARILTAKNVTLTDFAQLLQSTVVDRPVVEQSNLQRKYDFVLTWMPDESQFTQMGEKVKPPGESADAPGLFTAMQEQLGLKLSAEKTSVDVMVIDRIEQPSPN
jgi:uncharacterized protein (TIGR03435 family)